LRDGYVKKAAKKPMSLKKFENPEKYPSKKFDNSMVFCVGLGNFIGQSFLEFSLYVNNIHKLAFLICCFTTLLTKYSKKAKKTILTKRRKEFETKEYIRKLALKK